MTDDTIINGWNVDSHGRVTGWAQEKTQMDRALVQIDTPLAAEERLRRATDAFEDFMAELGLDTASEHLRGTPRRVAKMFLTELFNPEEFSFTTFPAEESAGQHFVVVKDIPFSSLCAHHFVPFYGVAHVGYIPRQTLVGLSKFARTVDYCARRPQVQERLTEEVTAYLNERLSPLALGVVMEAEHMCMTIRGVGKPGAKTITSALRGKLLDDPAMRDEFYSLVGVK